ncbi:hypothetical protein ETC03_17370 [Geobacillus sp. MMMUD3]|nr:hypothetical protein [Geobacillus sp. MMMUD3]
MRGIWASFRRVSRREDGCLQSSEAASTLAPPRAALVYSNQGIESMSPFWFGCKFMLANLLTYRYLLIPP